MSDKLPERTFAVGDRVWTPSAGFCVLREDQGSDKYPLTDGVLTFTPHGHFGPLVVSRAILTLDEAKVLGLEMPKVKRKVKRYAWMAPSGSVFLMKSDTELARVLPLRSGWARAKWLDLEVDVEVEGDE